MVHKDGCFITRLTSSPIDSLKDRLGAAGQPSAFSRLGELLD